MKTDDIIEVYKVRCKKLSNFYQKVLEDFGMDDIHHFRIEVKKLRAFIRLTNLITPVHEQKIPKEIKKFYNSVGHIRNLQLHQQRIINLAADLLIESPDRYLEYLRDEEESIKKRTRQFVSTISLKEFEKKLISSTSEDLTKEIKTVFVRKSRQRLDLLFTLPLYYDEALHDIRKVIKDLMYNYKYVRMAVDVELPPALTGLKKMETLTASLGDFHDLCVSLFLLSPIYMDHISQSVKPEMDGEFRNQIQLRKEAMKNEIIQSFVPVKQQIVREIVPLLRT